MVGSAETGSPSQGTLASLREASTTPVFNKICHEKYKLNQWYIFYSIPNNNLLQLHYFKGIGSKHKNRLLTKFKTGCNYTACTYTVNVNCAIHKRDQTGNIHNRASCNILSQTFIGCHVSIFSNGSTLIL